MTTPKQPKIYHIVHVDRLSSILSSEALLCDSRIMAQGASGTTIGMNSIKERRLHELTLDSYPDLYVGECVPFYFCPRSIMLYVIHRADSDELSYKGGQDPIIHLQADLHSCVKWAIENNRRWAFTLSNAGSYYFEDKNNLSHLNQLDWDAINSTHWQRCKEGKQAEFLMECDFPWHLVEEIGVKSKAVFTQVVNKLQGKSHRPPVNIKTEWYY